MAIWMFQDPSAQEPWLIALDIGGIMAKKKTAIFLASSDQ